jgi:hypothetical protein
MFNPGLLREAEPDREDKKPTRAGQPTDPKFLEELAPYNSDGVPIEEVCERFELPAAAQARNDAYMLRLRKFRALDNVAQSQIQADLRWNSGPSKEENGSLWHVQLVGSPDSAQPPIVLRAANEPEAKFRYCSLCGVTNFDPNCQLLAAPYRPPAEGLS